MAIYMWTDLYFNGLDLVKNVLHLVDLLSSPAFDRLQGDVVVLLLVSLHPLQPVDRDNLC